MPKLKNILVPAVSGFVLSFLISLIARVHFFRALLRAGIFGVAFGALAVGISILYEKFLSEGLAAQDGASDAPKKTSGNAVDITIADEELTPDEAGPRFDVKEERRAPLSGSRDAKLSHTPLTLTRPASGQQQAEAASPRVPEPRAGASRAEASGGSPAASVGAQDAQPAFRPVNLAGESVAGAGGGPAPADGMDSLDELPEIGELNLVGSDSLVEDSDFAEEGTSPSPTRVEYADGSSPASQDAETMAKAIRTLLKRED